MFAILFWREYLILNFKKNARFKEALYLKLTNGQLSKEDGLQSSSQIHASCNTYQEYGNYRTPFGF
jgi:hypothetical protein